MSDIQSAVAAAKAPKVNWDKVNPELQYEGRHITLPGDPGKMPIREAIKTLTRVMEDEEQEFAVQEWIDAYPHDAAVAFVKAMTKLYGWASPVATPGFFGPQPPSMLTVQVGVGDDEVVQCPMGRFVLPGVSAPINTAISEDPKGVPAFVVYGKIKKKDRHLVLELVNEARRIVKEESIYKGKAIRIGVDEYGNLDQNNPPKFFDASDTSESSVILDEDIMAQIDTSILVPIRNTALCKKHKIPLKRGVLLHGKYGTGKSLTARMVANVCNQNGWTFVLLDKVQGLRAALEFANRYAPAVVFAEDIDRVATERDEATNDLINTIDGVLSKRAEIMTVLTTNHAEKLNPVILRPGRLDAVIELRTPSAQAAQRLIRFYAGKLLANEESVETAGYELAGQIPASIRECVERAKLGMIGRGDSKLNAADLVTAAKTMKNHLALLNKDQAVETAAERLAKSLHEVVGNGTGKKLEMLDLIADDVKDIHRAVA